MNYTGFLFDLPTAASTAPRASAATFVSNTVRTTTTSTGNHSSRSSRRSVPNRSSKRVRTMAQHSYFSATTASGHQVMSSRFFENDAGITLCMDLPGVFQNDLEVSVEHGVLLIQGLRRDTSKRFKFSRRFAVDTAVVDMTRATANLANGVLVVKAPKIKKPTRLVIPVTEYTPPMATTVDHDSQRPSSSQEEDTTANASSSTEPTANRQQRQVAFVLEDESSHPDEDS